MRNDRSFLWLVLGLALLLVCVAALGTMGVLGPRPAAVAAGAVLVALGAVFLAWPFTTAETAQAFGPRRSAQIARVMGTITVLLGIAVAVAG